MRRRELRLLAAALAAGVSLAEAYLRFFNPQDLMTPAYTERMGYTAFLPNIRIREVTRHFDATYHTNDLGFRGESHPVAKPAGAARILALGASYTFGTGVQDDEVFTSVLEKRLNAASKGPRYEVLNFGWGGTPMNFHELLYRKLGRLYDPDFLIVHLHFTGPEQLAEPYVIHLENETPPSPETRSTRLRRYLRLVPGYTFLCEHSHLWALKRKSLAGQAKMNDAAAPSGAVAMPLEELQRKYIETFDGLVKSACAAKTKVLVVEQSDSPHFPIIEDYLKGQARGPCVSLLDVQTRPEHIFGKDEPHWNSRGHAYVAETIFGLLRARVERH